MPYFFTLRPRILSDVARSLAAAMLPWVLFRASMILSLSKIATTEESEPEGIVFDVSQALPGAYVG